MPSSRARLCDRLATGLGQTDGLSLTLGCVGFLYLLHPFPPLERVYPKISSFHNFGAGSVVGFLQLLEDQLCNGAQGFHLLCGQDVCHVASHCLFIVDSRFRS